MTKQEETLQKQLEKISKNSSLKKEFQKGFKRTILGIPEVYKVSGDKIKCLSDKEIIKLVDELKENPFFSINRVPIDKEGYKAFEIDYGEGKIITCKEGVDFIKKDFLRLWKREELKSLKKLTSSSQ